MCYTGQKCQKGKLHKITKFDSISQADMLYYAMTVLMILLLMFQVAEESEYNCSDFDGHFGSNRPLVECPPAKFMLKDNLKECFDNYTKTINGFGKHYFCVTDTHS